MTKIRTPLSCAALAFALAASTGAIAPAAAYDGKPVARYHLENAWPKAPAEGALADLPGGPKSVAPGPPDGDKGRRLVQAPGPKAGTTAWHELVLNGDIVAARRSSRANGDGKYVVRALPGRPK
jgi:hypothetical protein